jgi:transposase-like protein
VKLVINTGRPVATVARELGFQGQPLGRCVKPFKARQAGDRVLTETEYAELLRLRKDNAELRLDRAFLEKTSLFFVQEVSDTNAKRSN